MRETRRIRKVIRSKPTIEGAGVHLKRAFGFGETRLFDPFLLLDDFRSQTPDHYRKGFPWHPHRGIETITYLLRGDVEHGDSLGNQGIISAGDVQWMTAGSGVIHQEMPKGAAQGALEGFQLWANLPASHKMMDPRYRDVKSLALPEVLGDDGTRIRVICGTVETTQGPVRDIVTDPEYLDVTVPPNATFVHSTPRGHTVLAYVIAGRGRFGPDDDGFAHDVDGASYFDMERDPVIGNENLILWADGDQIVISAADQPVRFLLLSGKPIGEPVAWYGPIVMNTQEELRTAFQELRDGSFIKHQNG